MKKSSNPSHPESVRVGPFNYHVRPWTETEYLKDGNMGECNHHLLTIRFKPDLPETAQAEVVLHEVLHAIWWTGAVKLVGNKEESLVSILSYRLLEVIRDNPDLMEWLQIASRVE